MVLLCLKQCLGLGLGFRVRDRCFQSSSKFQMSVHLASVLCHVSNISKDVHA